MNYQEKIKELLVGISSWNELKVNLESFNTTQTETSIKDTDAGKLFEHFSKAFFIVEPEQNQLYKNVWLYDEIPIAVKQVLNFPQRDFGIDLLLQDIYDRFIAVQCKFKNNEQASLNWSKDKLGNAFGLAEKCDSVLVFTNVSRIDPVTQSLAKFKFIGYSDLLALCSEDFEGIRTYLQAQSKPILKKNIPHEHQKEAINGVIKHFEYNDRGQLILPCGAGKTLAALWINERLKSNKTLVLFPSLALLRQFKTEWSRHRTYDFDYICVCSEKDIDKNNEDTTVTHTYEITGEVTTNPARVNSFLNSDKTKIVFSTYQSIEVIEEALKKNTLFSFDLIICDEAHRTAGSKKNNYFTIVHNNDKIRGNKRLYMTATPKVVSNNLKVQLGEDYELLCDMSNPEIFGSEAYRMSFGTAIQKGILVDYKIIGIGVTHKQVKDFIEQRRYVTSKYSIDEIAHNYALDIVMEKYKAFHCITFHHRVKLAKEFSERHNSFFPDNVYSKYVEGGQPTSYRASILNEFKNNNKGVVSNARCLTEGVDVPTIDLIYFCDPKTSKIDIVQASGRALRKASHGAKKLGYIVVPIFHYKDDDVETEIERKPYFQNLISVIRSLCDQDERLQAEINEISFDKGKKLTKHIDITYNDGDIERIIRLDGLETRIKEYLFDQIIEKTRNFWEVMFKKIIEFKNENGHTNVTRRMAGMQQLSDWVTEQRRQFHLGKINPDKKNRLADIGFDWKGEYRKDGSLDELWSKNYFKLEEYFNENGDSNVPSRYSIDKTLANWVVAQREKSKAKKLEDWKRDLLNELNFDWNPKSVFNERFGELVKYKRKFGDTMVPTQGKEYATLGRSVNKWRMIYRNGVKDKEGNYKLKGGGSLTKEKIEKLNRIGFVWFAGHIDWEERYNELKEYFLKNGHSNVKQNEDPSLYNWCYNIKIKKYEPTQEQIQKLNEIKFEFGKIKKNTKHKSWDLYFKELVAFKEKYGNLNLEEEAEYNKLFKWGKLQKYYYSKGTLPQEKIEQLENIGFVLDESISKTEDFKPDIKTNKHDKWSEMFEKLVDFKNIYGHFFIRKINPENTKLIHWIYTQRVYYKNNKLEAEQIEKLNSIGFKWSVQRGRKQSVNKRRVYKNNIKNNSSDSHKKEKVSELNWLKMFDALFTFVINNGHSHIPRNDKETKKIATWLVRQRRAFRAGLLSFDQIEKFKRINVELNFDLSEIHDKNWFKNYTKLKEFHSRFNHSDVPFKWKEDKSLSIWVCTQRYKQQNGFLSKEKISLLNKLKFNWKLPRYVGGNPKDSDWIEMYIKLEDFKKINGHCNVSQLDKINMKLGRWLSDQRILYSKGRLTDQRRDLLNELGVIWNTKVYEWEQRLQQLSEYYKTHGNFDIRQNDKKNSRLYYLLYKLRRHGTSEERKEQLEMIGFDTKEIQTNDEN